MGFSIDSSRYNNSYNYIQAQDTSAQTNKKPDQKSNQKLQIKHGFWCDGQYLDFRSLRIEHIPTNKYPGDTSLSENTLPVNLGPDAGLRMGYEAKLTNNSNTLLSLGISLCPINFGSGSAYDFHTKLFDSKNTYHSENHAYGISIHPQTGSLWNLHPEINLRTTFGSSPFGINAAVGYTTLQANYYILEDWNTYINHISEVDFFKQSVLAHIFPVKTGLTLAKNNFSFPLCFEIGYTFFPWIIKTEDGEKAGIHIEGLSQYFNISYNIPKYRKPMSDKNNLDIGLWFDPGGDISIKMPYDMRNVPIHPCDRQDDGGRRSGPIDKEIFKTGLTFSIPFTYWYKNNNFSTGLGVSLLMNKRDWMERNYTNNVGSEERGVGAALTFCAIKKTGFLNSLSLDVVPEASFQYKLSDYFYAGINGGVNGLTAINGWDRYNSDESYQKKTLAYLFPITAYLRAKTSGRLYFDIGTQYNGLFIKTSDTDIDIKKPFNIKVRIGLDNLNFLNFEQY